MEMYTYITSSTELQKAIQQIRCYATETPLIALSLEGDNLSRSGTISIISIAIGSCVYLFDVLQLDKAIFDLGLREILEDKHIEKIMFGCPDGCDALLHLFNVNLSGVVDVQLLELMKRPDFHLKYPEKVKRSERHKEVFRLEDLRSCIHHYIKKIDGTSPVRDRRLAMKIKISENIWAQRPLSEDFLLYSAQKVQCILQLYIQFDTDQEEETRLRQASSIYSDIKRSRLERTYSEYEKHNYLPIDVLPFKGCANFVIGSTLCVGCNRLFPESEFSKNQLRKKCQMCRVCKKIKSYKDGQSPYMKCKFGSQG